jgi:hypothetical protein
MQTLGWAELGTVCKGCLSYNGFYLLYAALIFFLSLIKVDPFKAVTPSEIEARRRGPPVLGELSALTAPRPGIVALLFQLVIRLASFDTFRWLIASVLAAMRTVLMAGDHPTFLVSLKRYFFLYVLIIPLPAAFMAPVTDTQRVPDFQLLSAVLLLICLNAMGDTISVRLTLRNFEKLTFAELSLDNSNSENFWLSVRNEATYYFAVVRGTLYSLLVLICVLALSNVLYAVQVGQLDFAVSGEFLREAWKRMRSFPDIVFELYWFRGQPGPFGLAGIPGLFLYGLTTFIPIIILFFLGLAWLLLLPFRIAVTLPAGPVVRAISSECAVFVICVFLNYVLKINVLGFYAFLMHKWITW